MKYYNSPENAYCSLFEYLLFHNDEFSDSPHEALLPISCIHYMVSIAEKLDF